MPPRLYLPSALLQACRQSALSTVHSVALILLFALVLPTEGLGQERAGGGPESAPAPQPASRQGPRTQEQISAEIRALPPRYLQWVQSVLGLITQAELDYFLDLVGDYRRDAFMEAFWQPRDPVPATRENELRARWQESVSSSNVRVPFTDARAMLYLLNGAPQGYSLPDGRPATRCFSRTDELEIWFYSGSERLQREFIIILLKRGAQTPYEAYNLGETLRPRKRSGALPTKDIRLLCADEYLRYALSEISRPGNYEELLETVLKPPLPSSEWLANFSASTTDLPKDAVTFPMVAKLTFPERNQSRTAVQVLVEITLEAAPGRRFDGELFHNFLVTGEVIRDGRLFESFNYQFEGPTEESTTKIPLGFTRYLRPGPADLRVLVHDVYGKSYSRLAHDFEVPSPEGRPEVRHAQLQAGTAAEQEGPSLRLLPPPGATHVGMLRFQTRARGEFDKVAFFVDDKQVISKRRPPYSVELNLGQDAAPHRVRVVGFSGTTEIASDQVWLNQGSQRLRVRFIEPRPGGIYPGSLTARIAVDTPDGTPPERVEIFLNDVSIGVLEEGPYVQTVRLADDNIAVVRAVATLADGVSAEDAVVVNAAGSVESVEVRLVEIYALVVDENGQLVTGLAQEQFTVLEDGVAQSLRSFEETRDAPLQLALLLDRSASMQPHLETVGEAAFSVATNVLQGDEDRISLMSFADDLSVDVALGSDLALIERAMAGMVARGGTALYDGIVQALGSFDGVTGAKALLLFSDGNDEGSSLSFEQSIAAASRAGVTIHTIGLAETYPEKSERRVLEDLAAETGGQAHFITTVDQLGELYEEILAELRTRYLLTFQSASQKPPDQPRELKVEVDARRVEVRARKSYRP